MHVSKKRYKVGICSSIDQQITLVSTYAKAKMREAFAVRRAKGISRSSENSEIIGKPIIFYRILTAVHTRLHRHSNDDLL